jgi:hypothetical protein
VMIFASTDGTNSTLIGCSGVPISDAGASVATGASVGASVAGASVTTGAAVAAGPQALKINETATITASRTNEKRFFIFSPLKRRWVDGALAPDQMIIIQNKRMDKLPLGYFQVKVYLFFYQIVQIKF